MKKRKGRIRGGMERINKWMKGEGEFLHDIEYYIRSDQREPIGICGTYFS